MAPIVFMYSGQGAQYYGMGREFYDSEPVFRETLQTCNEIAADLLGVDLIGEIYGQRANPYETFEKTSQTHPANFMMGYSLTQMLLDKGLEPDFVLGYSLGEYIASVVAGALPLERAMTTIIEQGCLFEDHTPEAGMLAILAKTDLFRQRPELFRESWLACLNFPNHFVVTATKPRLAEIEGQLNKDGITCQLLPISRGFHSPIIDDVAMEFPAFSSGFAPLTMPVISSRLTDELPAMNAEQLWAACRQTVRFSETMANLERRGPHTYIDVGPAGTLMNFAKYNLSADSKSRCLAVMNPFGKNRQSLTKLLNQMGLLPANS